MRNATGNAWFATLTCVRALWCVSVTNATTGHSKAGALYAEGLGSRMLTTAKSVRSRRKTEMVVLRLSTSGALRRISSMNVRNMDSKNDDQCMGVSRLLDFLCYYVCCIKLNMYWVKNPYIMPSCS